MIDGTAIIASMQEEMVSTYPLPDSATPLVHVGETIVAGAVIARSNRPSALVAYAATLGISAGDAAAIERHDGETYRAGAALGMRRVGLRTRVVSAPVCGVLHALPRSGALVIRDESGSFDYRARYGGIVRAVNEREIVVASEVFRTGYAFAAGTPMIGTLCIVTEMLAATLARDSALTLPANDTCTVIAHIADTAALSASRSRRHGTLLVGSVSEEVAWQLMARSQAARQGKVKSAAVVVLSGVGDADAGIAAAAAFDRHNGALMLFERLSRMVVALPVGTETRDQPREQSRQPYNLHTISPHNP